jgi:hypothetical protein
MNMLVSTAVAGTAIAAGADPIHQAIAGHAAAYAALNSCLETQYALEAELPKHLRKSNINDWETKIVETDDPRWIETEKNVHHLFDAEINAAIELISVEPTTLAGAAALMRYVASLEAKGHTWPDGLQDDDAKPTAIGKDWEVYLHRNITAVLERTGFPQAA